MKRAQRIWPGLNANVQSTARGTRLMGDVQTLGRCRWEFDCEFESTQDGRGEWRARVNPGWVNTSPAFIDVPAPWLAEQVANGSASHGAGMSMKAGLVLTKPGF